MIFAIIAAGEGSRLAAEGIRSPKPLVKVHDEHLVDRLIRIFMNCHAEEIHVICNDLTPLVSRHLEEIATNGLNGVRIPLKYIVKSTPSSMHSFFELSPYLRHRPFVLTTVDTIFREDDFVEYINHFEQWLQEGGDGLMGVTDYIDDEKPLYVGTDAEMNITGFYDNDTGHLKYISGGIYGLNHHAIETLNNCMNRGESRMRNFQRGLVKDARKLKAFNFTKVLDIDHASDIRKAEEFIGLAGKTADNE